MKLNYIEWKRAISMEVNLSQMSVVDKLSVVKDIIEEMDEKKNIKELKMIKEYVDHLLAPVVE